MTKVAWSKKRDEITKVIPGAQRKTFVFNLRRKQYDELLGRLADHGFATVSDNLRANLVACYEDVDALPADTDVERKRSATIRQQLARLVQP